MVASVPRKSTDAVIPDFRQTELRNAVEKISGDLCISRPKSRLDWGIELPFDNDFVTYVWFDALLNYISFAGYDPVSINVRTQPSAFRDRWPALQVIGKDILVPAHGIYWLIMLHALGFPTTQIPQLLVHGWWNLGGAKMSKSVGNVVDPFVLADKYGADAVRYYLMSDMATGNDADFCEERLDRALQFRSGELARQSSEPHAEHGARYRDGKLKRGKGWEQHSIVPSRLTLSDLTPITTSFLGCQPGEALQSIWGIIWGCNQFVEASSPWTLAKDPQKEHQLDTVLLPFC